MLLYLHLTNLTGTATMKRIYQYVPESPPDRLLQAATVQVNKYRNVFIRKSRSNPSLSNTLLSRFTFYYIALHHLPLIQNSLPPSNFLAFARGSIYDKHYIIYISHQNLNFCHHRA